MNRNRRRKDMEKAAVSLMLTATLLFVPVFCLEAEAEPVQTGMPSADLVAAVETPGVQTAGTAGSAQPVKTASRAGVQRAYEAVAGHYQAMSGNLVYGSEWAVFGLCRGGANLPGTVKQAYFESVEKAVKECEGVLDRRKATEYARVALTLSAIGYDASDVAGYDLTAFFGNFEKTTAQGINGPAWALIALDSGGYSMPQNKEGSGTQVTREMYVDYLLSREAVGGGWMFSGEAADPDMTAMVLCALAAYRDRSDVSAAVERGIGVLSSLQNADGGYASWGTVNSESCAQVLIALCSLGLSPEDPRFVKNGNLLSDQLLSRQLSDGTFEHSKGGGTDGPATEQALCALAALSRSAEGQSALFCLQKTTEAGATVSVAKALLRMSLTAGDALGSLEAAGSIREWKEAFRR